MAGFPFAGLSGIRRDSQTLDDDAAAVEEIPPSLPILPMRTWLFKDNQFKVPLLVSTFDIVAKGSFDLGRVRSMVVRTKPRRA